MTDDSQVEMTRFLCLKCHDTECQREHVGHPGTCDICLTRGTVTVCARRRPIRHYELQARAMFPLEFLL